LISGKGRRRGLGFNTPARTEIRVLFITLRRKCYFSGIKKRWRGTEESRQRDFKDTIKEREREREREKTS
jgi:hypothetical protein